MSLNLLKEIMGALSDSREWHAHLLSFAHSKRHGTSYNCRRIELAPSMKIDNLIQNISSRYVGESKSELDKYLDVREYDGTYNATTIYRISEGNPDIEIGLDVLFQAIADTDSEADPFSMKPQAYILCGNMKSDDDEHQIKLISMNTPITTLRNRFFHDEGKFYEVPSRVLNLRTSINVIIFDRTVYFFDMSGEKLFNMERAYKLKCYKVVSEIEKMGIVSDLKMFRRTATSGQNPRRFAAFSNSKLQLLTKKNNREKVSKCYRIPLTGNKEFDTSQSVDSDNLVKILCGKAMWDVLEDIPVEVDGSKDWVS